jgi:hypothetical protein
MHPVCMCLCKALVRVCSLHLKPNSKHKPACNAFQRPALSHSDNEDVLLVELILSLTQLVVLLAAHG